MTVVNVQAGGSRTVQVETLAPTGQLSTNATVVVTGSELDARPWRSVAYTVSVATNSVDWSVFGANDSAYADEVAVLAAATVAAGAASSYAVAQAPYAYYRVKILTTANPNHGTATVRAIAKG